MLYLECKAIGDHGFGLPKTHSENAGGFDLQSTESRKLFPGEQRLIGTGWAFAIPNGFVGLIRDRSGMAGKRLTTRAGVIDSDYRGEVKVLLVNEGPEPYTIAVGDRIAQMLVMPIPFISTIEVSELKDTIRGSGGFGSTGV